MVGHLRSLGMMVWSKKVSISSPSSEGGGLPYIFRTTIYSPLVSISSPSSEGGGKEELFYDNSTAGGCFH